MSRCFPFPPPGYEKKPQSDHIDLLIKKHKEKKYKKEKRGKEKRDSKERKDREKDKDRSRDKHREKKGRKEKHRDKDKKKDKDKSKDEKRISYERKDGQHTEGHNDRKPGEDNHQAEELKNSKFTEKLGRKARDAEKAAGNKMGETDTDEIHRRVEDMGISVQMERSMCISAEKERSMGSSAGKERTTCISGEKERCLGSSAEKERNTGNEVHTIAIPEQKRMVMFDAMEDRGARNDHNLFSAEQRRIDGPDRPMDKNANGKIERKEKAKERKVDGQKGDKHKDKDRDKKHKEKDKARNKEKEKEEKIREKAEHKHREKNKLRDSVKKEKVGTPRAKSLLAPKDDVRSAGTDGCPKRKETNGFLHESEVRPNKVLRPSSYPQFSLDNGNKSDQRSMSNHCLVRQDALSIAKVEKTLDNKEHKINGVIDVHLPSIVREPQIIADAAENGETSKKSPHPDEKHLSEIWCVPKMEEWLEFDDQEWLLTRDKLWQNPKTKLKADETPSVWAEAMRIESADVLALPYVIPY